MILADAVNRGILRRIVIHHFTFIIAVATIERIGVSQLLRQIRGTRGSDHRIVIHVPRIYLLGEKTIILLVSAHRIALYAVDVLERNHHSGKITGSELICDCL